jgi:hypothetical protein
MVLAAPPARRHFTHRTVLHLHDRAMDTERRLECHWFDWLPLWRAARLTLMLSNVTPCTDWPALLCLLSCAAGENCGISATNTEHSRCDFAQRRVFHFHDCAHGDGLRRRQECHGFRLGFRTTVPWSFAPNVHHGLMKPQHTFFMGEEPQEAKLGGC